MIDCRGQQPFQRWPKANRSSSCSNRSVAAMICLLHGGKGGAHVVVGLCKQQGRRFQGQQSHDLHHGRRDASDPGSPKAVPSAPAPTLEHFRDNQQRWT